VKSKPNVSRLIRGGGWHANGPSWLRGADRHRGAPSRRDADIGFRPVLDSPKEKQ